MQTYIKHVFLVFCLVFASCDDVINVNVPEGKTRLVIEASLDWERGTYANEQFIKLSKSSPYFQKDGNNAVTGALVKVTNNNTGAEYIFDDENDGTYTISNFSPVVNHQYTLEIVYDGETYIGKEILTAGTPIEGITQSVEGGFDSELLEVNIFYNDRPDEENFYLTKYMEEGDLFPVLQVRSDDFVDGNQLKDFWEKRDDEDNNEKPFQIGDKISISLYGISKRYYNYMQILIEQYEGGGSPFSSTAAQLKGNCVNSTNPDNYPYGYFRLTQFEKVDYTFQ